MNKEAAPVRYTRIRVTMEFDPCLGSRKEQALEAGCIALASTCQEHAHVEVVREFLAKDGALLGRFICTRENPFIPLVDQPPLPVSPLQPLMGGIAKQPTFCPFCGGRLTAQSSRTRRGMQTLTFCGNKRKCDSGYAWEGASE